MSIATAPEPAEPEAEDVPETAAMPVIDIAPLLAGAPDAVDQVGAQLRAACDDTGFFFITGHGVDPAIVADAFARSRDFFALPDQEKQKIRMNRHQCGWMAPGISVHRDTFERRPDALRPQTSQAFKFTWDLAPDDPDFGQGIRFRGHNQWPDPAAVPGLHSAFTAFHATFEALALRLLAPLAVSLGLPPDAFGAAFDRPSSMSRIACYPPVPDRADRINTPGHRDLGFLTLIPPATRPGLEIHTPDGRWIAQPVVPEGILVNTGVTLQRWTNDRYVATPHRVRADAAETRYSNIFFLYPRVDATVAALPTCHGPDNPPRYPAETFGAIHAAYCARNFAYAEGLD